MLLLNIPILQRTCCRVTSIRSLSIATYVDHINVWKYFRCDARYVKRVSKAMGITTYESLAGSPVVS
jgi:hypothetical protein